MKRSFWACSKMVAVVILSGALTGCFGKASAPASFYMMAPLAPPASNAVSDGVEKQTLIAVDAVRIPDYLDRNQIVTRIDETGYQLAELDQWAESMNVTLTRVISENLSRQLHAGDVEVFASARWVPFDYRIDVEVLRLDGKIGDQVTLTAQWGIFKADKEEMIFLRKSEYQEKAEGDTYSGIVIAQSRLVETLSREIAAAVQKVLKNPASQ